MLRYLPTKSDKRSKRERLAAFTLMEMLVGISITLILGLILVQMAIEASRVFEYGQAQNDYHSRARAALNYMGRELRSATLGVDPERSHFQFMTSPANIATKNFPDSVFWIAPIATDTSLGDMAEVGYFVQWTGNQSNLCRFFLNSGQNYQPNSNFIYSSDPTGVGNWITEPILSAVAPDTKAASYQGMFLENVLGLWIQAYDGKGNVIPNPVTIPNTSSTNLPVSMEIAVAFLDAPGATRLEGSSSAVAQIKALASASENASTPPNAQAEAFAIALKGQGGLLQSISGGVRTASIDVNLDCSRAYWNTNAAP